MDDAQDALASAYTTQEVAPDPIFTQGAYTFSGLHLNPWCVTLAEGPTLPSHGKGAKTRNQRATGCFLQLSARPIRLGYPHFARSG